MELKKAIENRASVREFLNEPVPKADIKEMVRLAGLAPSINNYQPWKFISITNRELLKKMSETVLKSIKQFPSTSSRLAENIKSQTAWYSTFFENAPVLLALASEPYESFISKGVLLSEEEINLKRNYPDIQGVGACIQNLLLAAVELGYGACWLAGPMFAQEKLESLIQLEKPFKLMTFVAIGKTNKTDPKKNKRNIADEMSFFE